MPVGAVVVGVWVGKKEGKQNGYMILFWTWTVAGPVVEKNNSNPLFARENENNFSQDENCYFHPKFFRKKKRRRSKALLTPLPITLPNFNLSWNKIMTTLHQRRRRRRRKLLIEVWSGGARVRGGGGGGGVEHFAVRVEHYNSLTTLIDHLKSLVLNQDSKGNGFLVNGNPWMNEY